eukprot:6233282-Lingulodinium_polyedra.AAC.1
MALGRPGPPQQRRCPTRGPRLLGAVRPPTGRSCPPPGDAGIPRRRRVFPCIRAGAGAGHLVERIAAGVPGPRGRPEVHADSGANCGVPARG